jgi:hypothetical protein
MTCSSARDWAALARTDFFQSSAMRHVVGSRLDTETEVRNFLTASGATPKLVISNIPLPRLIYQHDLDALVRSIELHGFGDPPKYDARDR